MRVSANDTAVEDALRIDEVKHGKSCAHRLWAATRRIRGIRIIKDAVLLMLGVTSALQYVYSVNGADTTEYSASLFRYVSSMSPYTPSNFSEDC